MKRLLYIAAFTMSSVISFAQQGGVSINTTGTAADSSAMLDVSSTSTGILVPRMDSTQRVAIKGPAEGLLVYQTDGVKPDFYYYTGTSWQHVGAIATQTPHIKMYTPGSYTFTTSTNITSTTIFKITLIGGGGGGGGTPPGYDFGGSGGASGDYVQCWVTGLSPNTGYSISIGHGGLGGLPFGQAGHNGEGTFFNLPGSTISAGAGCGGPEGGSISSTVPSPASTGCNGVIVIGADAYLTYTGQPGSIGISASTGGDGASSTFGTGGLGGGKDALNFNNSFGIGNNGAGNGGGGGGAHSGGFQGGAGSPGVMIIEWSE